MFWGQIGDSEEGRVRILPLLLTGRYETMRDESNKKKVFAWFQFNLGSLFVFAVCF